MLKTSKLHYFLTSSYFCWSNLENIEPSEKMTIKTSSGIENIRQSPGFNGRFLFLNVFLKYHFLATSKSFGLNGLGSEVCSMVRQYSPSNFAQEALQSGILEENKDTTFQFGHHTDLREFPLSYNYATGSIKNWSVTIMV